MPARKDEQVMGTVLKHWIAAVLFAFLMSSVQRLGGEGSQSRSAGNHGMPWPGCGCHSVAAPWHCMRDYPLELIPSSWVPVNSTKAVIQLLPMVCSKHPSSCHARLAACFCGEGERLILGSLSGAPLHLPHSQREMCLMWRNGQHLAP